MRENNNIIDGKGISDSIRVEIKEEVHDLEAKTGKKPGLAVIIVGKNPASTIYVKLKHKACEAIGLNSFVYEFDETITQDELVSKVRELNKREDVNGILVQLPLPKHIDEDLIINSISVLCDVDCFHPENVGHLLIGNPNFLPCTPAGIMELLKRKNVEIEGKRAVILGRSNIVGKPISLMLLKENATVTVCHSKTKNLEDITKQADILVAAIGKPNFVTSDMVKDGAVVIDVGINRVEGRVVGDVDFKNVKSIAGLITPVPGGVGPMTITMLIKNTIKAFRLQNGL